MKDKSWSSKTKPQNTEKQSPHIKNCTEISRKIFLEGLRRNLKLGPDTIQGSN
jgi:hypothetical protein